MKGKKRKGKGLMRSPIERAAPRKIESARESAREKRGGSIWVLEREGGVSR